MNVYDVSSFNIDKLIYIGGAMDTTNTGYYNTLPIVSYYDIGHMCEIGIYYNKIYFHGNSLKNATFYKTSLILIYIKTS